MNKRKLWAKRALWGLLALLVLTAFDVRLLVRHYGLEHESITTPVRIALVTDLHSCRYGEDQSTLLSALEREKPDLVLLGGDLFDHELDSGNTELFLAEVAKRYACYAVTGNHELSGGTAKASARLDVFDRCGITLLRGDAVELTVNGQALTLCGADDPSISAKEFARQMETLAEIAAESPCSLLLAHRPDRLDTYAAGGFDYVLCGHAHGGQWRIPGLLNGVYAPHQGFFPPYAGGIYEKEGTTMVVSRGLAREITWVPRIFNRPELVILELT